MRCTERTPIDDDAENAEIRPLERKSPTILFSALIAELHANRNQQKLQMNKMNSRLYPIKHMFSSRRRPFLQKRRAKDLKLN